MLTVVSGEFSAALSLSLTNESDIPEDAELAETFYFEDEFEDDEDLSSSSGEEDFSALVGHMKSALEGSASWGSETGTQQEDFPSEGMSNTLRERRINRLRAYPSLCICCVKYLFSVFAKATDIHFGEVCLTPVTRDTQNY